MVSDTFHYRLSAASSTSAKQTQQQKVNTSRLQFCLSNEIYVTVVVCVVYCPSQTPASSLRPVVYQCFTKSVNCNQAHPPSLLPGGGSWSPSSLLLLCVCLGELGNVTALMCWRGPPLSLCVPGTLSECVHGTQIGKTTKDKGDYNSPTGVCITQRVTSAYMEMIRLNIRSQQLLLWDSCVYNAEGNKA